MIGTLRDITTSDGSKPVSNGDEGNRALPSDAVQRYNQESPLVRVRTPS